MGCPRTDSTHTDIDPYKVLHVRKNFTEKELKDAYRLKALQAHPDKGGTEEMFQLVTQCFAVLANELKRREASKCFTELKANFEDSKSKLVMPNAEALFKKGDRFDNEKFNRVFEETKITTPHDKGYDKFVKSFKFNTAPSATSSTLNEKFEQFTKETSKALIVKTDPVPQHLCSQPIVYEELGVDKIHDFTSNPNANLQYCDLQQAHTVVRLAPDDDKKKRAHNVDELQRQRTMMEKNGFALSAKEARKKAQQAQKEQAQEARRMKALVRMDELNAKRINNVYLLAQS